MNKKYQVFIVEIHLYLSYQKYMANCTLVFCNYISQVVGT